ncbi:MAG: VTT domain-containing protein [Clostridia bacterium]|nr:VTT domain-containing protein [Clostridia bacterium]
MKAFFKRNKKALLNILLILASVVAISVVTMLLLMAFDIVYFDDGMKFNLEIFHSFRTSWYGWIIFIVLQTVLSVLLCVIPGASMAFILLSQAIYPIAWQAFILSFASVMISSASMYMVGRFGGYKLCTKMLGEEDCEKSLGLLRNKGTVFFPLMMMFPIFPDDALVMIAGTLKMSLKWFIPSIVFGRGIGIATIIFGLSIVPFERFTAAWHWIGFILLCVLLLCLVFFLANKFNKMMERKKKEFKESETESTDE